MSRSLHTVVLACALGAAPSLRAELVKPTISVHDMRVIVAYVSNSEFVILQAKYGTHIRVDLRDIRQNHRRGLSILKTNRATGERTCEIYLPERQRPVEVDDEGTLNLGHELLHCMLGDYHR
jgi:hypothetical protein